MIRPGPWDVATLGEEQGVKPGTYIVDSKMEPLALVIDDYAENMLAAGPSAVAALKLCVAWMPWAEVRSWPPGFRLREEAMAAARKAIADAERGQ